MKMKKLVFIALGCIGAGLGAVGAVLPLLPAFPFLLLAAFSFAKSSDRLRRWFVNTKLCKNNLESYMKGRGMTRKTKLRIMGFVTLAMAAGFRMLEGAPVGRVILAFVWTFHALYFLFGVKTLRPAADVGRPAKPDVEKAAQTAVSCERPPESGRPFGRCRAVCSTAPHSPDSGKQR